MPAKANYHNSPGTVRRQSLIGFSAAFVFILWGSRQAIAFPQFQEYSQKHSKRSVDCSMCHINSNGPSGTGYGQIDSLTQSQLDDLNHARAAMEPNNNAHNPLLNEFGNHIVHTLGMTGVMETVADPAKLPAALGDKSDLDGDGISDAQEFLDGTDPLNRYHGDPGKLFWHNLNARKLAIVLLAFAVIALNFGLFKLFQYLSADSPDKDSDL